MERYEFWVSLTHCSKVSPAAVNFDDIIVEVGLLYTSAMQRKEEKKKNLWKSAFRLGGTMPAGGGLPHRGHQTAYNICHSLLHIACNTVSSANT